MISIELLSIGGPIFIAAFVGCYALVANYLDDRATAQRQQQAALRHDGARQPAAPITGVKLPA